MYYINKFRRFNQYLKTGIVSVLVCLLALQKSEAQITTVTSPNVTVCPSKNVQLNTTPSGGTAYTYSWSPSTGLSNSSISNPVASVLVTTTYIVTVTDVPTTFSTTDTVTITVQNIPPPVVVVPQADTICQGESLQLNVRNGNNCLNVAGICQTTGASKTVGSGTIFSSTAANNPFFKQNNFFGQNRSTKHQYIFKARELNEVGLTGPTTITGISWDVFVSFSTIDYTNLTFKMGCTTDSVMTSTFKTGLTTVYNPKSKSFSASQFELFNFDQPYVWDGKSNIVIEVCFANALASANFPFVRVSNFTSNIAAYVSANSDVCSNTSGTTDFNRPNTMFHHCDIVHSSALTYSWSPATGLSSSTVRNPVSTPSVTSSYVLTATDINGCFVRDTAVINVAPLFNLSINNDTTLCGDDTLQLTAAHNSGSGANYKWTTSTWVENDTFLTTRAFFNGNTKVIFDITSLAGCALRDSFNVIIIPPVSAEITTADTVICAGDSLQVSISTNSYTCGTYNSLKCTTPNHLSFTTTSTFPAGGVTVSPFDAAVTTNPGQKKQYLFLASELTSLSNSTLISKVGFNLQTIGSTITTRNGFTIKMGCTSISSFGTLNTAFQTGLQTVFTPKTINIGTGWNEFVFDNAFIWDGVSNIIVEICWQNTVSLGFTANTMNYSFTSFTSVLLNWNSSNICSETIGTFGTTIRPEMRFGYCTSPPNALYDFLWTPSATVSNDTIPEPLVFPTTGTYYYLKVSDPLSGCYDEDSLLVSVAPDFTTTVSSDTTLCSSDTVMLNVSHTSVSTVSYNWQPANLVSDSSISSPFVFVNGAKTIISEVRSNAGCIKWDTVTLGIHDRIDLSVIAPSGQYCEGDTVQLDANYKLACGQSNGALCTPSSVLTIGSSTVSTNLFNVTPFIGSDKSSKKQYIIRKSELNAAGMTTSSQFASISFEIDALGKPDYQNFTIKMGCTGLTYFNGSFVSGNAIVFEPKDVVLTPGKNWFDFDHRYNWDGNSNIVIEICYNNSGTGSNSDVFYSVPNPNFNCTQYARGNSVCQISSGTAYNRRPNIEFKYCVPPGTSYAFNWLPSTLFDDPSLQNPFAKMEDPGLYKLALSDISSGCTTEDSVFLDVLSFEVKALTDTSLCTTENFQLDVNTTAVQPKFLWNNASQLSNDTIKNPVVLINNGVNYIVEVTDTSGCKKKDTVDIILLPVPNALALPKNSTICRNEIIQLQGSGGGNYLWSPATGLSDPNLASPTASVKSNTMYHLLVTNAFGCEDEDSLIVNVFPSPVLDLGPDTSHCTGGLITLNAGGKFKDYLWQDNSKDSTYDVGINGVYYVRVTDNFDCIFTDTVNISLAPSPVANIKYRTEICVGDSVILDAGNPGSTYLWSTGEITQMIVVKNTGFISVEIDNGKCLGLDSTVVYAYNYPVSYLSDIEKYCEKENPYGMTLTAGSEEYSYKWSNGQVTNSIIVTDEGTYQVVITNGGKCSIEKSVEVQQVCSEIIFVPNTFTPNNDWKNDVFRVSALNLDKFEFRIFNRWGEVVYYSENPDFEWNGEKDGKMLPDGVYVWKLNYSIKQADGSFKEDSEEGTVTLLR